MEKINLKAEIRSEIGKELVKKIRNCGFVPAVVYKAGEAAKNLKVSSRALFGVLHTEAGENVIINLSLSDSKESKGEKNVRTPKKSSSGDIKTVVIKEIQYHPVTGNILHIDFNQILLTEKLTVDVPVGIKGESQGVKEGGVLEHILWEVKVECLPTKIPEKIEVDISDLKIGDFIHVKDLSVPEDVSILSEPDAIVVSVKPPTVEKVEEEVEGEVTEPEVITEKKKEGEPEEPGKPEKPEKPEKSEKQQGEKQQ